MRWIRATRPWRERLKRRPSGHATPWAQLTWRRAARLSGRPTWQDGVRFAALSLQLQRSSEIELISNDWPDMAALEARNLNTCKKIVAGELSGRQRFCVPSSDSPCVSIIIPAMNQYEVTVHCLASLVLAAADVSFEVILVDDASDDQTKEIEHWIEGVRVCRNPENLGYLHSCNRAAELARGSYLLMLNNDTEAAAGFLDEMLRVFEDIPETGAVGAKLVYPNGVLQDAGGMVFENGLPWNVGNGAHPDHPLFNYRRDADYLTGAALLVRTSLWRELGGYDPVFAPAYYEDTDLSFRIRKAGYRTVYCPHAVVIHYEGASNGTDIQSGVKQYQQKNAETFVERWIGELSGHGASGRNIVVNMDRRALRVLMLDTALPVLGQDAGSHAAFEEVRLIQGLGAKVTFFPQNMHRMEPSATQLQREGVEVICRPFYGSLREFLQKRGSEFDAVYFTRHYVAEWALPAVRRYAPRAKRLMNLADLHFLREMRSQLQLGGRDLEQARITRDRELAAMRNVDAILCYSETEREIITTHLMSPGLVHICPWVERRVDRDVPFADRTGLCFLGGFRHPPNRDALQYLAQTLMPALAHKRPDIHLHVFGSQMDDAIRAAEAPNIHIHGFAESLHQVYGQARVFVAPLRSGAGIKGKVLGAMAHGLPIVLSPVAAEGTGLNHGQSGLIVDEVDQWVDAVISLHDDEQLWLRLSASASDLLEARFSQQSGTRAMAKLFSDLGLPVERDATRLTDHRMSNMTENVESGYSDAA